MSRPFLSDLDGCFTRIGDSTWRVSDCEELVGQSQEMMGLVLGYYSLYVTLLKCSDVPEILEVQVVASYDVRMVPDLPTATKGLFP